MEVLGCANEAPMYHTEHMNALKTDFDETYHILRTLISSLLNN